ncbi:MAG: hypothetical protein ACYCS7_16505 [Acidimicrobiales bacterium]
MDGDQLAIEAGGRSGLGLLAGAFGLALADLADDLFDFGIGLGEEVGLADECVFDLAGEEQPVLGGPGAEVTQGADDLLPRTVGGMDGLNQQVIGVSLILVTAGGFSHVHGHYGSGYPGRIQRRPL